MDAFSLLEEFIERGDYFKANHDLTNAVLGFISLSFLAIVAVDLISVLPDTYDDDVDENEKTEEKTGEDVDVNEKTGKKKKRKDQILTAERVEIITKSVLIVINNFPFLVIRCYLFRLYGFSSKDEIDFLFLLFIVKEATVIVLGVSELIVTTKLWHSFKKNKVASE